MWDLVQIYLGNSEIVQMGYNSFELCMKYANYNTYLADGMASYTCQVSL